MNTKKTSLAILLGLVLALTLALGGLAQGHTVQPTEEPALEQSAKSGLVPPDSDGKEETFCPVCGNPLDARLFPAEGETSEWADGSLSWDAWMDQEIQEAAEFEMDGPVLNNPEEDGGGHSYCSECGSLMDGFADEGFEGDAAGWDAWMDREIQEAAEFEMDGPVFNNPEEDGGGRSDCPECGQEAWEEAAPSGCEEGESAGMDGGLVFGLREQALMIQAYALLDELGQATQDQAVLNLAARLALVLEALEFGGSYQ